MQDLPLELQQEIQNLNSDDSNLKRQIAEKYLSEELNDEVAKVLANKLLDDDIGVRDAVSQALIYNENQNIPYFLIPFTTSKMEISTRNLAGEILLKRGTSSLDAMIEYIDEGDDDDKKFLVDLMGLIGDSKPSDKIREILRTNENENVLLACIEALGNIHCVNAVNDIVDAYKRNELFKPTAIEALGNIGSAEAVNFIVERYKEEDELTKFSMIESLGLIGDEAAFFLLLSELKHLNGPLTWAAILSLKMLQDKLGIDVPFDESIKNSLLKTLSEGELKHKRAAASLISVFEDREIILTCLKIYGTDEEINEHIKSKFFENPLYLYPKLSEYLKNMPSNANMLLGLLGELITFDGGESIQELSPLDLRNLCDVLTMYLEHADEEVRRIAIELLFFLGLDTALLFIDTMIEDDNFWNRLRVVEILENIDDERAIEGLQKLSEDPEEMVSERAQEVLNQRS